MVFVSLVGKNGFPRNIPMRLHLLLFYSSKHDPQKKRDKKHRRILRLNFSDFPWKLRIKKSHRNAFVCVRFHNWDTENTMTKLTAIYLWWITATADNCMYDIPGFMSFIPYFDNADNAVILPLCHCCKKYIWFNEPM